MPPPPPPPPPGGAAAGPGERGSLPSSVSQPALPFMDGDRPRLKLHPRSSTQLATAPSTESAAGPEAEGEGEGRRARASAGSEGAQGVASYSR